MRGPEREVYLALKIVLVKNQEMRIYVNFNMCVHSNKHTAAQLHSGKRGIKLGKTLEICKLTYNPTAEEESRKNRKLLLQLFLT